MERRYSILFVAVALIHLAPLWIFPFFPTQDGPAHLETGYILANYQNVGLERIREYVELKPTWSPNILTQFLLAGLIFFVKPVISEKILLSIYVLAFPLSFRYWIRRAVGQSHAAEFMIFPFIYNYFVYKGFYNFVFSVVGFFLIMGFFEQQKDRFGLAPSAWLLMLVILNYFCHLVGTFYACVSIGTLVLARSVADAANRCLSTRELLRRLRPVALTGLPVVVFTLLFTQEEHMQSYRLLDFLTMKGNFFPIGDSVRRWLSFDAITAFEPWENWARITPIILFGGCLITCLISKVNTKTWRNHDIYFVLFLALFVVYLRNYERKKGCSGNRS